MGKLGCRKRPRVGVPASGQHRPPDVRVEMPPGNASVSSASLPSALQAVRQRPQTSWDRDRSSHWVLPQFRIHGIHGSFMSLCFEVAGYIMMITGTIHRYNYSSSPLPPLNSLFSLAKNPALADQLSLFRAWNLTAERAGSVHLRLRGRSLKRPLPTPSPPLSMLFLLAKPGVACRTCSAPGPCTLPTS